jgi:superfamily II DNA/RNA helicase
MGFIPDTEEICTKLPKNRQTLLFSATMPPPIKKLADKFLNNPKTIEVARPATANINIAQFKVKVGQRDKRDKLRELIVADNVATAIVFANRKTTVRELAKSLKRHRFAVGEIHGDMDQSSRIAELDRFKKGEINILCASDVAARGLDVKGVSHVFNFDTPWHPDDYIHRIGRTGRAGAKGRAFTLVTPEDAEAIANIEKLTGLTIPSWEGGGKAEDERPREREDDEREDSRPARRERGARSKGRGERDERPRREDRPAPAAKPAGERPAPAAKPARKSAPEPEGEQGWNGPVPAFLDFSVD